MPTERELKEELLLVANKLQERRENDPLSQFHPHAKQKAFIDSVLNGEAKENWFLAGNRAGKSDAGAYIGATLARFGREPRGVNIFTGPDGSEYQVKDRSTAGWVSALDFPTARDVIQPKYFDNGFVGGNPHIKPFIPDHEIAEWRVSDQVLKLKNGSIIGFKSADSGRRKYQGAGKDWFHMDEEHPWEIYEESVIRVGHLPLLFFCTATILPPEGTQAGVASWVFGKIINPYLEGRLKHAKVFGASIYDNPGIDPEEIRRLESIYPEGSLSRRIRLDGEWLPGIGGSIAYAAFNRQLHVSEQPEIAYRRPLIWTWDFNVEPMCSLVMQKDGMIYRVYQELILDGANIPEMCQMFYDRFPNHGATIYIYGDATSNRRTGQTGRSDYFLIQQEMKQYGVPISLKVPQENPKVPDRVNAVNRVLIDEDGQVRLSIDPRCQELIADLEGVLRDQKGGILKTHNRKDPYFRRTHTSDALGYCIAFEEPVRPPSTSRHRHIDLGGPRYGFNR